MKTEWCGKTPARTAGRPSSACLQASRSYRKVPRRGAVQFLALAGPCLPCLKLTILNNIPKLRLICPFVNGNLHTICQQGWRSAPIMRTRGAYGKFETAFRGEKQNGSTAAGAGPGADQS